MGDPQPETDTPAPAAEAAGGADAFIASSARDHDFVRRLARRLHASDITTWPDHEDLLPQMPPQPRVLEAVDAASCVVVVLSPALMDESRPMDEVRHADRNGKRLLVVLRSEVEDPPSYIRAAPAIDMWDDEFFTEGSLELVNAIGAARAAGRAHADLLTRAKRWRANGQPASLLLAGAELDAAEGWLLARHPAGGPRPVELQHDYVRRSRGRVAARDRRRLAGAVAAVVAIALLGGGAFLYARDQADTRDDTQAEATSRSAADQILVDIARAHAGASAYAARGDGGDLRGYANARSQYRNDYRAAAEGLAADAGHQKLLGDVDQRANRFFTAADRLVGLRQAGRRGAAIAGLDSAADAFGSLRAAHVRLMAAMGETDVGNPLPTGGALAISSEVPAAITPVPAADLPPAPRPAPKPKPKPKPKPTPTRDRAPAPIPAAPVPAPAPVVVAAAAPAPEPAPPPSAAAASVPSRGQDRPRPTRPPPDVADPPTPVIGASAGSGESPPSENQRPGDGGPVPDPPTPEIGG